MDQKKLVTAMALVVTAIGAFGAIYLYLKLKKSFDGNHNETNETDIYSKRPSLQEQRDIVNNIKKKGNEYYNGRLYDEAINCYIEAMAKCPPNCLQEKAILYQNKSACLHSLNRLDEALDDVNCALNLFPRYKTALIRRSKIYEDKDQLQDALNDMAAAVTFDSSEKSDPIDRMDKLVKNITMVAVNRKLTEAPILRSDVDIKKYLESFRNDPFFTVGPAGDVSQEQLLQCVELLRLGKYEDSFRAVQEALLLTSWAEEIQTRLHLLRGTFYLLSCREQLAIQDLEFVISSFHGGPLVKINALIKLATIVFTNDGFGKNSKDWGEIFEEAIKINPEIPDIYFHRSLLYEISQQNQEALDDCLKALGLNPEYACAAVHKIFNEYMLSESNKQHYFQEFESLITMFPTCIEVYTTYIKVLMTEKKIEEAETMSESLLSLSPDSGMSLIGKIKISQDKFVEAKEVLLRAVKSDPKHSNSYHLLAYICIRSGGLSEASEHLVQAITYAKNKNVLRDYLGLQVGISAQLSVAKTFDIPVTDVINKMCPVDSFLSSV